MIVALQPDEEVERMGGRRVDWEMCGRVNAVCEIGYPDLGLGWEGGGGGVDWVKKV